MGAEKLQLNFTLPGMPELKQVSQKNKRKKETEDISPDGKHHGPTPRTTHVTKETLHQLAKDQGTTIISPGRGTDLAAGDGD